MKNYVVDMQKEYGMQGGILTCYVAEKPFDGNAEWKRPALVIAPGGGYNHTSKREAEPLAFEFLARGFHTFVLHYRTGINQGVRYPEQLLELSAAVDYVKTHADELCVNKDEVFAMGFSAGGHLVADLAVEYADIERKAGRYLDCKPTAVVLGYPVISQIDGHQGSFRNLLNEYSEAEKEELLKTLNLDQAVSETTVPAFIWATAEDKSVPVSNAIRFASALNASGVPFELHIYPQGKHGLSTGSVEVNRAVEDCGYLERIPEWLDACEKFLRLYIEERF